MAIPAARTARTRETAGPTRTAAASGIVFALLLTVSLVLVAQGPRLGDPDPVYQTFVTSGASTLMVTVGLYLVPFAGIAWLWHMTALRLLVQTRAPGTASSMPMSLHLAAGVLFVALLFAGTATAGGVALLGPFAGTTEVAPDVARALAGVGYTMVFVYGVRAAGMAVITTTRLVRRAGLLSGPLAVASYVLAAVLLLSTTFHPAILLVFPGWVLALSVLLLVRRPEGAHP